MLTADFDYHLPPERIAQEPLADRDVARLLRVTARGLEDRSVRELPEILRPGDLLVINDTRVIPARLQGRRASGGRVEVTLHKRLGPACWLAFARPTRRLSEGEALAFDGGLGAEILAKQGGELTLAFDREGSALMASLEAVGEPPLPPYIRRAPGAARADRETYQTVFARHEGAVAAPTAGLHFTPHLLSALEDRGIGRVAITLHVGAGTFLPVTAERAEDHVMHAEWGQISSGAACSIEEARAAGGRIVAVGTTALRLLESASRDSGQVRPFEGDTDLFIRPGYRFRAVDLLMTNFHLPRSSLMMLVAAFAGLERIKSAYTHAIAAGYRFYSYGDATLLEPESSA